jgi:hypothetical protein
VALQISRASEALYGEAVPPETIRHRYLTVDNDGRVVLRGKSLSLQADFPHLRPRRKGPLFPVVLTTISLLWALVYTVFLRSFRATITDGKRKAFFFAMLFVLLAVHVSQYAFFMSGTTKDFIVTGTIEILVRRLGEAFPGSVLLVWIACGLLLFGAYRFAESAFLRIEVPPMPAGLNPIERWFSN